MRKYYREEVFVCVCSHLGHVMSLTRFYPSDTDSSIPDEIYVHIVLDNYKTILQRAVSSFKYILNLENDCKFDSLEFQEDDLLRLKSILQEVVKNENPVLKCNKYCLSSKDNRLNFFIEKTDYTVTDGEEKISFSLVSQPVINDSMGFFRRIKNGLRYVCNYGCRFGNVDEFTITEPDAKNIIHLIDCVLNNN